MIREIQRKQRSALGKTIICLSLSTIYFAMLAWPFGLSDHGYMLTRAILAGLIMFAISVPAWVIAIKKEFAQEKQRNAEFAETTQELDKIGQLALKNRWLSPEEVKQIMYCQKVDGRKFGEVAVKRNFLTLEQVSSLLDTQSRMTRMPVRFTK